MLLTQEKQKRSETRKRRLLKIEGVASTKGITGQKVNATDKKKQKEGQDADRVKRTRDKLKNDRDHTKKAAWKCTCKKPVHDEKCQLFSTEYGTRKWMGKNVGVTEDDLHFLSERESLAKRQKRK